MKTTHASLLVAILTPAALVLSSCGKVDAVPEAAQAAPVAGKEVAVEGKVAAVDSWNRIKDYPYEKRDEFADGLDRLAAKRDVEIRDLNAKAAGLPEAAAHERDRAVKEFTDAQSYLKSQLNDLRTGTPDTWNDAKGKVVRAWQHVQAAYEKVKAKPTA